MEDPIRKGTDGTNENVHNFFNILARAVGRPFVIFIILLFSIKRNNSNKK